MPSRRARVPIRFYFLDAMGVAIELGVPLMTLLDPSRPGSNGGLPPFGGEPSGDRMEAVASSGPVARKAFRTRFRDEAREASRLKN